MPLGLINLVKFKKVDTGIIIIRVIGMNDREGMIEQIKEFARKWNELYADKKFDEMKS